MIFNHRNLFVRPWNSLSDRGGRKSRAELGLTRSSGAKISRERAAAQAAAPKMRELTFVGKAPSSQSNRIQSSDWIARIARNGRISVGSLLVGN